MLIPPSATATFTLAVATTQNGTYSTMATSGLARGYQWLEGSPAWRAVAPWRSREQSGGLGEGLSRQQEP